MRFMYIMLVLFVVIPCALATDSVPSMIQVSDDKMFVYYSPDFIVEIYDTSSFKRLDRFELNSNEVFAVALGENAFYFGYEDGTFEKTDLDRKNIWSSDFGNVQIDRVTEIDNKVFVSVSHKDEFGNLTSFEIFVMDAQAGNNKRSIGFQEGPIRTIVAFDDYILSSDNAVYVRDRETFEHIDTLRTHDDWLGAQENGYRTRNIIYVDGKVYTAYANGAIGIWDVNGTQLDMRQIYGRSVMVLATDGEYIYTLGGHVRNATERNVEVRDFDLVTLDTFATDLTVQHFFQNGDIFYVATNEGAIVVYEKGSWERIKTIGEIGEAYDIIETYQDYSTRINPAIPIVIGIAILFLIILLIELRSNMKKQKGKKKVGFWTRMRKALCEMFSLDDMIKIVILISVLIGLIGMFRPLTMFPKFLPGISFMYYFDILISSGAYFIVWFLLPPLVVYKHTKSWSKVDRVAMTLFVFCLALVVWFFVPKF